MNKLLNNQHNYLMMLAEGRFINESLYGLIESVQQQNLKNKFKKS